YKDPFEAYQSLSGEIEARNTQARMNMSEEERQATPPEQTQDIKNADALVVFDDGTAMDYNGNYIYWQGQLADRIKNLFKPLAKDIRKYRDFLKKAVRGELNSKTMLQVSSVTPEVYKRLGIADKPLNMKQSVLKKGNIEKHDVPYSVFEDMPELVSDPILVLNSKTVDGSLVAVLDAQDENGDTVVAIIEPKEGAYNVIPSVHGRENLQNLINTSVIRYVDKERASKVTDVFSLQLRDWNNPQGYTDNILQKSDIVNRGKTFYQMSYYDDLGYSKSVRDVKTLLSGLKPKEEVRLMYDKKKRYWFAIDADNYIHNDMITKAYKQGLYPEFRSEYDARQYFDENYNADDEYLIRFKATSYNSNEELQDILHDQLNQDEYTTAYSLSTGDGKGYIIFARGNLDLSDSPLRVLENTADRWERNPYKMTEVIKTNVNYQGNQSQTGRGGTARGAYSNNIIYLFENADASTIVHELGHWFLDDLVKYGKSDKAKEQLQAIYDYLGVKDGVISREQHEYFADSFEVYLKEGVSPNSTLKDVFNKFKDWLKSLWREVKRLEGIKLTGNK
ncbi:MAG: hypothetical protein IJ529_02940, partial [Alphaproteobacteria bacterium]|nr:hypothetical protein [Alphaproteobacteria bacterium]